MGAVTPSCGFSPSPNLIEQEAGRGRAAKAGAQLTLHSYSWWIFSSQSNLPGNILPDTLRAVYLGVGKSVNDDV